MKTQTFDLISCGEFLIDFTPCDKLFTYTANPGGAPANVAIAAAKNGLHVGFLGKLGDDDFGKRLINVLTDYHVTPLIAELTKEAITTLAFVTLYDNGERSFTFTRKPGADMLLSASDIDENLIANCRIFHSGSFSLSDNPSRDAVKEAMKLAKKHNRIVSFDINYRSAIWDSMDSCKAEVDALLPYIDLLKISDEELFFVGGENNIPNFMEEHHITVVIQTLGSHGVRYYFNKEQGDISGYTVHAIDATGAGDAFWGGFLSSLLMSGVSDLSDITLELVTDSARYGNAAGALCVQKYGAITGLPTKEEIRALIESENS